MIGYDEPDDLGMTLSDMGLHGGQLPKTAKKLMQ